jgi:hypothetical protein
MKSIRKCDFGNDLQAKDSGTDVYPILLYNGKCIKMSIKAF